ncbi:predicted protein [Naegleria gruberi]|uniref:Predicted protein n=1 Tax=Naegleria gruberi TaxID=5762 RepID=D2VTV2_NAEGR|nr:uncharacterized protein NAEGRDRAFT_52205 [Naegleria gruberi]EFC39718.1 predicted protein [Naegleria gruberi]|eukprot:XP_002672462.1 predicted protein [Naegleria gruberi strain NEG-M]
MLQYQTDNSTNEENAQPIRKPTEEVKHELKQDPFFTLRHKIVLEEGSMSQLIEQNNYLAKNPPEQPDDLRDWIYTLWILSDIGKEPAANAHQAFLLSKKTENGQYIIPSACRLIVNAYEGWSKDEIVNEILCPQSKPGEFKRDLLLCSEALLLIYIKKSLFLDQAIRFCFIASLFGKKRCWHQLQFQMFKSKQEQSYEEIMKDLRMQVTYGLLLENHLVQHQQRILECVQNENQIYLPEKKRERVTELMKGLQLVTKLVKQKNNPTLELEELILNGVLDEEKFMMIMASKPSFANCLRLFYALPGLKSSISKINIEDEWGAEDGKCDESRTCLSFYYVSAIHERWEPNIYQFVMSEADITMYGGAIENLVEHFIKLKEEAFAIALLEECVKFETHFVENIYESAERKSTVLYKCRKYLEWCMKLNNEGEQGWLEKLNEIDKKRENLEIKHTWTDSDY